MAIPLAIAYTHEKDTSVFPLAQMLYPAFGVMMARLLTKGGPKKIFFPYLAGTGLIMLSSIALYFTDSMVVNGLSQGLVILLSLYLLFQIRRLYKKDPEDLYISGLHLGNVKKGMVWILFFLATIFLRFILSHLLEGTMDEFLEILTRPRVILAVLLLPVNFLFTWLVFFGEEYGWRYFLQPVLQKKYGVRKGIILVGLIWGMWHLPLNLMFYNTIDQGLLSVITQWITCIGYGIFFGYVYQKTDSLWIVCFLHYVNNNLAVILTGQGPEVLQNNVFTWSGVALHGILTLVLFGGFLFVKELRTRIPLPTMAERLASKEISE